MLIKPPVQDRIKRTNGTRKPPDGSTIPTITTRRLVLRAFTAADSDPLFRLMNDPAVMRHFPNPIPPAQPKIDKLIAGQLAHWKKHKYGWWAVTRRQDETLIGWCGLQYLPETDEIEVAYLLGRPHWGHGYATEAAQAALSFGFDELGLSRIVGIVHPENRPSQRVLDRIGMEFTDRRPYFGMDAFRYERKELSSRRSG